MLFLALVASSSDCFIAGTPALPIGYNPATWMLEVTGGSMATMVKVRLEVTLVAQWQLSLYVQLLVYMPPADGLHAPY
jgi:hypothetical protein